MADAPNPITPLVPHPSLDERRAAGRAARQLVRRRDLGVLAPPADRDPVAILTAQEEKRVPELVPLRRHRMSTSAFAFYRGAAAIFSNDISTADRTGLRVQLCGDAHLANFGGFASPERVLVFDLNDFDETLPGPFEWDLKRLAASFEVAGRSNGFTQAQREALQLQLAAAYAKGLARFAAMDHLDLWYLRLSADEVLAEYAQEAGPEALARVAKTMTKARTKDRMKAFRRLTVTEGDTVRFASDPPVLEPVSDLLPPEDRDRVVALVHKAFQDYRKTLQPDRRLLLERYEFVDLARKVVGVGSVGTRCFVALLRGHQGGDPLFLQVKEAEQSVLAPYLGRSAYQHQGRRVVEGQRLVQGASDIFLGWERVQGLDGNSHDHYFRQLWDWKVSADVDAMDPTMLGIYARLCGVTLARAHARSGDAVSLAAYVGGGGTIGRAMIGFASDYADLNERDHAAAVEAWGTQSSVGAVI